MRPQFIMRKKISICFVITLCGMIIPAFATGNYQEPSEFIQEVFSGDAPKVSKIWIKKDLKVKIRENTGKKQGVQPGYLKRLVRRGPLLLVSLLITGR